MTPLIFWASVAEGVVVALFALAIWAAVVATWIWIAVMALKTLRVIFARTE